MTSSILKDIIPPSEKSDMTLVARIRDIWEQDMLDVAEILLQSFPFWYHDHMNLTQQVFWSENHYIMNVSCEWLLHELLGKSPSNNLIERLYSFLDLKMQIGFAEFLSPVYLPFTITALLNLYDFTVYTVIKSKCAHLLDMLSYHVLNVSLKNGSIITPSGRSYIRHRESTKNHLSLFIHFLNNETEALKKSYDGLALKKTLLKTSYIPSSSVYNYKIVVNLTESFPTLLNALAPHENQCDIYVSLLWNYGAYLPLHKKSISIILIFMRKYNLWNHPHFKSLKLVYSMFKCFGSSCFTNVMYGLGCVAKPYATGSLLTNANMYVFKEGNVVMSSLMNYNQGLPIFQQNVWAVNLAGVPIWASLGKQGSVFCLSSLGNAEASTEMSTGKVTPHVIQNGRHLIVIYKYNRFCFPNAKLQVFWPTNQFDDHGILNSNWYWARKNTAVIAYNISNQTHINIIVTDLYTQNISLEHFLTTFITPTSD